jgi:hypothetical protein
MTHNQAVQAQVVAECLLLMRQIQVTTQVEAHLLLVKEIMVVMDMTLELVAYLLLVAVVEQEALVVTLTVQA